MFKTIQECRLELVGSTQLTGIYHHGTYYDDADYMPASAARASFGNEDKTGENPEADVKLMKYLADHQHMSPFEHQSATFLIECPLFIRSQIMRHRTFSYNEISRRYTDENIEFWIPDQWHKQASNNRQASDGILDNNDFIEYCGWTKDDNEIPIPDCRSYSQDGFNIYKWGCYAAWHNYLAFLESGVCREQARSILPQSLLTRFYMSGNLRNWIHFLKLRLDEHAQYEVRVVAERIEKELRILWPTSMEVLL